MGQQYHKHQHLSRRKSRVSAPMFTTSTILLGLLLQFSTLPSSCHGQLNHALNLGSKVLDKTRGGQAASRKNEKRESARKNGSSTSFFRFSGASASEIDEEDSNDNYESTITKTITEESANEYHQNCEIGFENIQVELQQKGKENRMILDGSIKGKARPGRMLAIMGPSGCGKSTLLSSLAGVIKKDKKLTVLGERYVNEEPITGDSRLPAAFIEQESNFFPHMTVKETLDFRVELKLGSKLGTSARDDVVANLMDLMGLTKSADTIVGNAKIRGLSGGERKRLSIACELISSPAVIFLDEPTSGLDSYQAAELVKFLRKLADTGKTIVSVIHQPSQSVFSTFDDLLLLSDGRLMYYGEVKNIRSYLSNLGYVCEPDVGTAEHVLNCISRTNGGPEEQKESQKRLDLLANEASKNVKSLSLSSPAASKHQLKFTGGGSGRPASGILRQFKLLLSRAFKEKGRGKGAIIIKTVQQVTLGLIYGGIYKLGNNQASVMDRFGLISLIGIGATNMAIAGTVRSFPKEKTIISSELSSGMYKTLPYFIAKAISEIPLSTTLNTIFASIIYPLTGMQKGKFKNFLAVTSMHTLASESVGLLLGSVSSSSDMALALMPPILVLNVIFDGRNISDENTPYILKWIPKVGLIRWVFEGLSINEFTGLEFDTSGPRRGAIVKTGTDALERFGIANRSLSEVFGAQSKILAGCWFLSFLGLTLTRQKFETMVTSK